jgi:biopolymer transport protein ExbB/TolQ
MILMMNLPQILQSAIYLVSTSLLYPVIIILLGMAAFIVVEIGMFSFEGLARAGRIKRGDTIKKRFLMHFSKNKKIKPKNLERGVLEAKALINEDRFDEGINILMDYTSKRFVYFFLDGLLALKDKNKYLEIKADTQPAQDCPDMFSINLEKLLQKCDSLITKRLERTKVMVRLGPMFGLMGTLIPMGPALLALTRGDVDTLANNLIIAFGTTVVGLLIGGVSYIVYTIRKRWYDDDMNDISYICEVLFGGR